MASHPRQTSSERRERERTSVCYVVLVCRGINEPLLGRKVARQVLNFLVRFTSCVLLLLRQQQPANILSCLSKIQQFLLKQKKTIEQSFLITRNAIYDILSLFQKKNPIITSIARFSTNLMQKLLITGKSAALLIWQLLQSTKHVRFVLGTPPPAGSTVLEEFCKTHQGSAQRTYGVKRTLL